MTDVRDERSSQQWDDELTARLLRLASMRADAAPDRTMRVRSAVQAAWRAANRQRVHRRRLVAGVTLVATAAGVALALLPTIPRADLPRAEARLAARVDRIEGRGALVPGDAVRIGASVETNAITRASLTLGNGASMRLDRGTRVRMLSEASVELDTGALYVDTGRQSGPLEIRTQFGTVRDIGTQFEVRLVNGSLRVRVRTGRVEFSSGEHEVSATAGSELTVGPRGVTTGAVSPHGTEWNWTTTVAPKFDIEGSSVAAFLEHMCREHGWTLKYADTALERDVASIMLHGSIDGLEAEEALTVSLRTSGLAYRLTLGNLIVSRARSPE